MKKPSLEDALETAGRQGWFSTRTSEVRRALGDIARILCYGEGETIYHFGDRANGIFGLVEGAIEVRIPRADGVDITIHRAEPGFWIGDLAFMSEQRRIISLLAVAPTQVLHLPEAALLSLLKKEPDLHRDFYVLSHMNTSLALQLLANLTVSGSVARIALRLNMYLDTHPDHGGVIHLTHVQLAELVALSPPTVERGLKELQTRGALDLGYGRITIFDRDLLLDAISGRDRG